MIASKAYVDSMISGTTWHIAKPYSPLAGDCYFDTATSCGYIWTGAAWVQFSGVPEPDEKFFPPTEEQLDMHPSLKAAWEEFMVIKRLLGV